MSKDLEKEYKELMSADAPDLWEKIEAGLEPKQSNVKMKSRIKSTHIWGMVAAACLCLVISVPILFGGRKGSSADGSTSDVNMSPAKIFNNGSGGSANENVESATTAGDDALEAEAAPWEGALVTDKLKNRRKFFVKNNFYP